MASKEQYINSVNLNLHTDFPYLVLNVEGNRSYPLNPGFRVMHWHEDLQFIYVLEGSVCVKTLDEEEIISAGEGIFINKNVVHLVEQVSSCRYKSFLFPEHFISFYPIAPAAKLTSSITDNSGISLVVLYESQSWCHSALDILRNLVTLEEKKDNLYPYTVLANLVSLWQIMLKNVSSATSAPVTKAAIRMRNMLQYIEAHFSEDISLDALAKSASISKSEALRCFKDTIQTTPLKYLTDLRLSKAARLLTESDLPINEISSMTGFNQQSYFGKCFKEKMGCSPSEFRSSGK